MAEKDTNAQEPVDTSRSAPEAARMKALDELEAQVAEAGESKKAKASRSRMAVYKGEPVPVVGGIARPSHNPARQVYDPALKMTFPIDVPVPVDADQEARLTSPEMQRVAVFEFVDAPLQDALQAARSFHAGEQRVADFGTRDEAGAVGAATGAGDGGTGAETHATRAATVDTGSDGGTGSGTGAETHASRGNRS
jgi:hypothetical protein